MSWHYSDTTNTRLADFPNARDIPTATLYVWICWIWKGPKALRKLTKPCKLLEFKAVATWLWLYCEAIMYSWSSRGLTGNRYVDKQTLFQFTNTRESDFNWSHKHSRKRASQWVKGIKLVNIDSFSKIKFFFA